ncbi:MAG: DUF2938 family protein [Desulfuromonadales bacterium]|jgi:hypothetical protein
MFGEIFTLIMTGVIAGIVGTIVMDTLNHLFSKVGTLSKIETEMIGRMVVGWRRGRFVYRHPSEMEKVANEKAYGLAAHYLIGIGLAVPFVLIWGVITDKALSPLWIFIYGVATTAASWFFVYPCMGFGAFGRLSPDGLKATLSSLANHIFYGIGLAIGIAFI